MSQIHRGPICALAQSAIVFAAICALSAVPRSARAQIYVSTGMGNNQRTGANTHEKKLTPANVTANSFGLVFTLPVDGYVYAQPLYMSGLTVNGAYHNCIFVATEHDSVYCFDADKRIGSNSQPLWSTSFINPPNVTTVPSGDTGSGDLVPEIGITSTPVIDTSTGTIYVEAKTKETSGGVTTYVQRLHALNILTGQERPGSPVVITAQVPGIGDGSSGGMVSLDPLRHHNRPALLLDNGVVYIGFASHGDNTPYHGWVVGYNESTLAQTSIFCTTPNGLTDPSGYPIGGGGIWQSGDGLASGPHGSIYFLTGNGTFDVDSSLGSGIDYGDSMVKLTPGAGILSATDYFTPYDQDGLNRSDSDLGSGGCLVLPDAAGSATYPHLMVGCGKEGKIYLVNRDAMGHYNTGGSDSQIVQTVPYQIAGTWSGPSYWNGNLYYCGAGDLVKAFSLSAAQISATPTSYSPEAYQYPGATPVVSAWGNTNGIVWALENGSNGDVNLHAYDATNLTNELYNSGATSGRDDPGGYVKFAVPTVANGKVYVPAQFAVGVYGPARFAIAPVITPGSGNFTGPVSVSITDATPSATIRYTTDGSTPTSVSHRYVGAFTVSSTKLVKARAFASGLVPSGITEAPIRIGIGPANGDGLWATYFSDMTLTTPVLARVDPQVNFNWNGNSPAPGVGQTQWSARWYGRVEAEVTGTITLQTLSDDGVRLFWNHNEVINDWNDHGPTVDTASVYVHAGTQYPVTIEYYQDGGGSLMQFSWADAADPMAPVPQSQLFSLHVDTPVIGPPGGSFDPSVQVSMTEETPGATIHYTTDGTVPTIKSTIYSSPFTLTATRTVRARAFVGSSTSETARAKFLLNRHPAAYQINSGGGAVAPYSADEDSTGGTPTSTSSSVDTGGVSNAAPEAVYQTQSYGDITYTLPNLTPGALYTVRLHFAELYYTVSGIRLFSVAINGSSVLNNYDVIAAAGGPLRAVAPEFFATADSTGNITITFSNGTNVPDGTPIVNAVEVLPN
ncbi:MAG: chitobiase/beta-hexosaminidase C-terminal domain-containing protein [Armatimonadetes bacterium]|nr:chitobiase/beta-hexosaminidase C-terminal domain-containing protein [Armatimonadota bacterium]MDE2205693.1 chitobiase/beta-hexosaminidase C-terminal domain-containing protein [Armatimonadota bacterium]